MNDGHAKAQQTANLIRIWRCFAGAIPASVCGQFLKQTRDYCLKVYWGPGLYLWRRGYSVISRLQRKSLIWRRIGKLRARLRQEGCNYRAHRVGLSGAPLITPRLLEFILIILIALLPWLCVLPSPGTGWGLFSPWGMITWILLLMWLTSQKISEPEKGTGLFLFWLTLFIDAWCAAGSRADYGKIGFTTLLLIMGSLVRAVLTRDQALKILKFLTFSSLIWMLIGWRQLCGAPTPPGWLGGLQSQTIDVRVASVFGNPNVFAIYLLPILSWAYYFSRETEIFWHKLSYGSVFGAALLTIYFTYSRTAWLIAAFFVVIWFGSGKTARRVNFKRGMVIAGALLLFWLLLPGLRIRILAVLTARDSAVTIRPAIWRAVWQAIATSWLWGCGPGSFAAVYPWYGRAAPWAAHAHQQYLQIWLENGLPALVAFGWVVRKTAVVFLRESIPGRNGAFAIGLGLVGFLGAGLTETWSASPFLGGFFWLMIGLGSVLGGETTGSTRQRKLE